MNNEGSTAQISSLASTHRDFILCSHLSLPFHSDHGCCENCKVRPFYKQLFGLGGKAFLQDMEPGLLFIPGTYLRSHMVLLSEGLSTSI